MCAKKKFVGLLEMLGIINAYRRGGSLFGGRGGIINWLDWEVSWTQGKGILFSRRDECTNGEYDQPAKKDNVM